MKEVTIEEAALAWAQGKRVEATGSEGVGEFYSIAPVGSKRGRWNPMVFNGDGHRFRLAPEPQEKKFRPWTPEEVPVGAIMKDKEHKWRSLIVGVTQLGHIQIHGAGIGPESALENHVHSTDGGKTWFPCGVEVNA